MEILERFPPVTPREVDSRTAGELEVLYEFLEEKAYDAGIDCTAPRAPKT